MFHSFFQTKCVEFGELAEEKKRKSTDKSQHRALNMVMVQNKVHQQHIGNILNFGNLKSLYPFTNNYMYNCYNGLIFWQCICDTLRGKLARLKLSYTVPVVDPEQPSNKAVTLRDQLSKCFGVKCYVLSLRSNTLMKC